MQNQSEMNNIIPKPRSERVSHLIIFNFFFKIGIPAKSESK